MRFNILVGGEAGQGPNILSHVLSRALVRKGFYVFYYRDYQSLIRGGHNFNIVTFSNEPVNSNDSKMNVLVALDTKDKQSETVNIHKKDLKKQGVILDGKGSNMFFAGRLFKILGIEFEFLDKELKELEKKYEENLEEAKKGYEIEEEMFELEEVNFVLENEDRFFRNGGTGISEGAINAGVDVYYAYPMTPATSVMAELAEKQIENNHMVIELENEIAVANAGVGSAITGAKTMVGTSGGGFDLMTETLSLTGIAEVPLVFYLAQRPGPGTGVATYQAQGDMKIALYGGHGEFQRVVLAPGDPKEAEELTTEAFYFSQAYKIPAIILSDKHLSESFYTTDGKPELTLSKKSTSFGRYNSYEKGDEGFAVEDPKMVSNNILRRSKKNILIAEESQKFKQYKVFGNLDSENVIVGWGSTKGAILDVIASGIDCKFVQMLYLSPFPTKDLWRELIGKNLILVENNSTGQLGDLIKEKLGYKIPDKNKILKFNGRPFFRDELEEAIKRRMK